MPPAFNLSQDQTLQFNPSKVSQSTLAPSQSLSLHQDQDKTFHRVSTSSFLHPSKAFAPPGRQATPAPTLIGCNFLKIRPAQQTSPGQVPGNTGKEARLYNVSRVGQQSLPCPRSATARAAAFGGSRNGSRNPDNMRARYRFATRSPPLLECPRHADRWSRPIRSGTPCPKSDDAVPLPIAYDEDCGTRLNSPDSVPPLKRSSFASVRTNANHPRTPCPALS